MAKKAEYDGSTPLSNPQRELFCELFTTNTLPYYWGHGQNCYSFAFGYDDRIQDIRDLIDGPSKNRKGKSKAKLIKEISKLQRTATSCAHRLLIDADIKLRCGHLMDKLAEHKIVDRELLYIIQQRVDLDVKARAIEHHDKRTARIREKIDLKHEFEPVQVITIRKPVKK